MTGCLRWGEGTFPGIDAAGHDIVGDHPPPSGLAGIADISIANDDQTQLGATTNHFTEKTYHTPKRTFLLQTKPYPDGRSFCNEDGLRQSPSPMDRHDQNGGPVGPRLPGRGRLVCPRICGDFSQQSNARWIPTGGKATDRRRIPGEGTRDAEGAGHRRRRSVATRRRSPGIERVRARPR